MAIDCLLINLTRFGDILQSQALIHDLSRMGLRTGLLCQENFAKTGMLLDGLSGIWALPGAGLLKAVDTAWHDAVGRIRAFSEEIRAEGARIVLNITPLPAARLLANLVSNGTREGTIVGFGIDNEGFGTNNGPWSTFLCAQSLCRENAVFNVIDLFRRMAAPLGQCPTKHADIRCKKAKREDMERAESILSQVEGNHKEPIKGFVAFQLGASSTLRQWPTEFFAALGDKLWEEAGLCPVLTGAKSELALQTHYAEMSHSPYVSAIGKTDLGVLSALLEKMRLLVSNDTGTLHLASALETKSVSFFLATAQPWDTGPALPGCLCLEPDIACHPCAFRKVCENKNACQRSIRPEPVARVILSWIFGASWEESLESAPNLEARAWETGRDAQGFAQVQEIGRHSNTDRGKWCRLQRAFWSHLLDRPNDCAIDAHPATLSFADTLRNELDHASLILRALEEQFILLGKSSSAGTLFLRNCDRLQTHLLTSRYLRSFGHYWQESRHILSRSLPELGDGIRNFRTHLDSLARLLMSGTEHA
ncbi:MAG: glycosyltransferase family 9 protein [Desulfovibrionaceae bacterium]|nr:glycosyltransferase family 9 protein [Desulfovibrionaceae bacterium]